MNRQLESETANEIEEADVHVCAECDGNHATKPFYLGDSDYCPNCGTREGKTRVITQSEYEAAQ